MATINPNPNGLAPNDTTAQTPTTTLLPAPTSGPSLSTMPGGSRAGGGSPSPGQPSSSTLPNLTAGLGTTPSTSSSSPAPSSTSTLPNYSNTNLFGGGWNQFATTPGSSQYGLAQQFLQGNFGQTAVNNLNQNPSTAGIEYIPGANEYGIPGGYYVSPTPGGSSYDLIQRAAGDNGQASSSSGLDLSGLLTALLSNFSGTSPSTQNAIASQAAPVAPATAAATPTTTMYGIDPTTGMPYGYNPATGQFAQPQANPVTAAGGPSLTTQSTNTSPTVIPVAGAPTAGPRAQGGVAPTVPASVYTGSGLLPPASGPSLTTLPSPGGLAQIDPTTGLPVVTPPGGTVGGNTTATASSPFSDPAQMQLWNSVLAALNQTSQPVGSNPETQALQAAITNLAGQLSGPAFSDQQLNDIRTASMDSIQSDEDNAVQAEIQRQELLGQSPTSGTVTDSVNKIKAAYTTLKGQADQADNMYELNTVTQRQQELLQTLNLGATTATNNQQLTTQNAVTGAELSQLPVSAEDTALSNAECVTALGNSSLSEFLNILPALLNFNQNAGQQNAQNNALLATQLGTWLSQWAGL